MVTGIIILATYADFTEAIAISVSAWNNLT